MSHNKKHDLDKECPICGGIIWGRGYPTLIEGAKIDVCQNCAQHGKKIYSPQKKTFNKINYSNQKKIPSKKVQGFSERTTKPELEIVDDYFEKIRKIRQKNNLTQEQFAQTIHEKESLIKRIEANKVVPSLELAKKIENEYQIKLIHQEDVADVKTDKYMKKNKGSTLGDLAFIKKKK
ncbi:MAG: TIGR00270 family protein [Candidatus Lokiarchaeota archaeon]|nr:TIGR00270 family protein [Candidatus Lokiarchaeota archaeon]